MARITLGFLLLVASQTIFAATINGYEVTGYGVSPNHYVSNCGSYISNAIASNVVIGQKAPTAEQAISQAASSSTGFPSCMSTWGIASSRVSASGQSVEYLNADSALVATTTFQVSPVQYDDNPCADKAGQTVTVTIEGSVTAGNNGSLNGCEIVYTGGISAKLKDGSFFAVMDAEYTGNELEPTPDNSNFGSFDPTGATTPQETPSSQSEQTDVQETTTQNPDGSETVEKRETTTTSYDDTVATKTETETVEKLDAQHPGTKAEKETVTTTTTHPDGTVTETVTTTYTGYTPHESALEYTKPDGELVYTEKPPAITHTGSTSTTTTRTPDGNSTSTTTHTGGGYSGGSSTGSTTGTTNNYSSSSITNYGSGDGSTSAGAEGAEAADKEDGGSCGILPDVVCSTFDTIKGLLEDITSPFEAPTNDPDVPERDFTPDTYSSGLPTDDACPAPMTLTLGLFGTQEISFQPLCDLAVGIRPFLIAMSYLLGMFIVIGRSH